MSEKSPAPAPGNGSADHLDEDVLLDLIHGLLSPPRREQAIAHAAGCLRCGRLLQERVAERERLRARRRLRRTPGGKLEVDLLTSQAVGGSRIPLQVDESNLRRRWQGPLDRLRSPRVRGVGFALIGAALAALAILWPRRETPRIDPPLFWIEAPQRAGVLATLRGPGGDENLAALAAGVEAYERHDVETAIRVLREAECAESFDIYRRVYLASALAHRGDHAEALALLRDLPLAVIPDEWGREGRWTMLVCLQALGRSASADSLSRLLAAEGGEIAQRTRRYCEP